MSSYINSFIQCTRIKQMFAARLALKFPPLGLVWIIKWLHDLFFDYGASNFLNHGLNPASVWGIEGYFASHPHPLWYALPSSLTPGDLGETISCFNFWTNYKFLCKTYGVLAGILFKYWSQGEFLVFIWKMGILNLFVSIVFYQHCFF